MSCPPDPMAAEKSKQTTVAVSYRLGEYVSSLVFFPLNPKYRYGGFVLYCVFPKCRKSGFHVRVLPIAAGLITRQPIGERVTAAAYTACFGCFLAENLARFAF